MQNARGLSTPTNILTKGGQVQLEQSCKHNSVNHRLSTPRNFCLLLLLYNKK